MVIKIKFKKQRIQRHEVYFRALFDHHQKGDALGRGHNLPLQRTPRRKVPQASSIDAFALSQTNSRAIERRVRVQRRLSNGRSPCPQSLPLLPFIFSLRIQVNQVIEFKNTYETDLEMPNLTEKASLAEHKSLNTLSFMVNLE